MGNTRARRCISSAVLERIANLSDDVLLGCTNLALMFHASSAWPTPRSENRRLRTARHIHMDMLMGRSE